MTFFLGGGSGFPGFPLFFLSCDYFYFGHSLSNLHRESPKHQKMACDSKPGWTPIRYVLWRSLILENEDGQRANRIWYHSPLSLSVSRSIDLWI